MNTILFVISIFIAIWFGVVVVLKALRGHEISWITLSIFSFAATAIITHMIHIW